MSKGENRKHPYGIILDRSDARSLSGQLYAGFAAAIRGKRIKAGDALLPKLEMARRFGVSEHIIRVVMARLTADGLVVGRPRLGYQVQKCGGATGGGTVLDLCSEDSGSYYSSVFSNEFRATLTRAGLSVTTIHVGVHSNVRKDLVNLKRILASHPDLVVVRAGFQNRRAVYRTVFSSGSKYVCHGEGGTESRCIGKWIEDGAPAVADFVRACKANGVKSVGQFCFSDTGSFLDVSADLTRAGLFVEKIQVRLRDVFTDLETLQRAAMVKMRERLASGPLPELLYFTDDYLTMGAMPVLLEAGVRIPRDVKIVTVANRGFGPVYTKSFARIEFDRRGEAHALADGVIGWMRTGKFPECVNAPIAYIPGETFPIARSNLSQT